MSLFLEAPENLAPPLPSALPLLYCGSKWNPPGYRTCEAFGDGPGDALFCRNLRRNLRRVAGAHLPPWQGRYCLQQSSGFGGSQMKCDRRALYLGLPGWLSHSWFFTKRRTHIPQFFEAETAKIIGCFVGGRVTENAVGFGSKGEVLNSWIGICLQCFLL